MLFLCRSGKIPDSTGLMEVDERSRLKAGDGRLNPNFERFEIIQKVRISGGAAFNVHLKKSICK
jgi:hypothetical protein